MNITSYIAKATRKVHALAVALHLKGLRATVKGAELRVKRANEQSTEATAVWEAAFQQVRLAYVNKSSLAVACTHTRLAAASEARQIGGTL